MSDLNDYVSRVMADIEATASRFALFERKGVSTHAIPFFGDVESAVILTVGVNPSAGEFIAREWPASMSPAALTDRLIKYFTKAPVGPHPWFETWTRALAPLEMSYSSGVAHLDLSPRATAAMGTHSDWRGFSRMVEADAKWFFELLPKCQKARAMLVAGCVTKRWFISDFIKHIAPNYGYKLSGTVESVGKGRVGFLRLVGPDFSLPVFFCSISPSGPKRQVLVERVETHRRTIAEWISDGDSAT